MTRTLSALPSELLLSRPNVSWTPFLGTGHYFLLLLQRCMDVETNPGPQTREGQSPLHLAASANDQDKLRSLLLQPGVDVDARTPFGQTALHLAAQNGHKEATRLLLISGADPKASDIRGCCPLHLVADCPVTDDARRQVVDLLCTMGVDLDARTNELETALCLSLRNVNLDMFKLLLDKGADVQVVDRNARTLLHVAAEKNVLQIFVMLDQDSLKIMSEKTSVDECWTPLHVAARSGHLDMVKALFERNLFSMHIKDILGQSALHLSVVEKHLSVSKFLVDNGWDVNEQATGDSCLHLAVRNNDPDAVKLLLDKGANADVRDMRGWMPIEYALSEKFTQIVELLQALRLQPVPNHASTNGTGHEVYPVVDWTLKPKKRYLVHGHLNNLKLNLALHRFFSFPGDYDQRAGMSRLDLSHSGFFFTFDFQSLQCFFCSLEIKSLQGWKGLTLDQMNQKHDAESVQQFGQSCPLVSGEEVGDVPIVNPTNYNYEAHRLYSLLERRWTNHNVSVYDLAKNGFYHTGQDDNCRCWFCKLEVRGWEPGDTAVGEHNRWNPRCSLLQTNGQTDNVPIGHELVGEHGTDANPFVKTDLTKCKSSSLLKGNFN